MGLPHSGFPLVRIRAPQKGAAMEIWMIVYKGENGKWQVSTDYVLRTESEDIACTYYNNRNLGQSPLNYRVAKFTAPEPQD
jgi:hypothetical protein